MKEKIKKIVAILLILLAVVIMMSAIYYKINYKYQTFDSILYHLTNYL